MPKTQIRWTLYSPVLGQAGAGGGVVLNPAGGVGPARGRVARVQLLHDGLGRGWQWDLGAAGEGVSLVPGVAGAERAVLLHPALGVLAAGPRAGVAALGRVALAGQSVVPDAGHVERAVAVVHALRLAVGRRVDVAREAGAAAGALVLPLL